MHDTSIDSFVRATARKLTPWAVLSLILLLWPSSSVARSIQYWTNQTSNLPHPHIAVSATGEVLVAPDRATIYFTLRTVDSTAAVAVSETEALRTRLVRAVAPFGTRAEEVTTWGYGAGPRGGIAGRVSGAAPSFESLEQFGARMGVRITTDSLDLLHRVVAAGLAAGEVSVPLVTFEIRDVVEAREAAVARAVRIAMRDAAALAGAAGGELGELLFLTSSPPPDFGNQAMSLYQTMSMYQGRGAETPLRPSDVTVRMMVFAAWRYRN